MTNMQPKKIIFAYWHSRKLPHIDIPHNSRMEYTHDLKIQLIDMCVNNGYSVMVRPANVDGEMIIWVDNGRFGQN